MRKVLVLLLVLTVAFSAFAQGGSEKKPAEAVQRGNVVIASGSLGGSWYPFGEAIGGVLKDVGYTYENTPGGGTANIVAVSTGAADLGMTMTTSITMAETGDPTFKGQKYTNLSSIMWLMDDPLHVLVSADSGIKSFSDLKGKSIGVAAIGQLSLTVAMDLLNAYGITEKDVKLQYGNPSDHASLYKDGHIDAWLYIMPIPASNAMDMAISRDSKMIQFSEKDLAKVNAIRPGYSTTVIPANTYKGITEDVVALNTDVVLVCRDDASEDWVYDVVKTMVEGRAKLGDALAVMKGVEPSTLGKLSGIKVHPGAVKYFKEIGVMK